MLTFRLLSNIYNIVGDRLLVTLVYWQWSFATQYGNDQLRPKLIIIQVSVILPILLPVVPDEVSSSLHTAISH